MTSRIPKVPRVRAVALAVGVGVLGSFAFTGTGLAAAPSTGTACQAADGKVSGRGATFQTKAQQALIAGYTADVCGPVAAQYAGDPAASDMITYNYAAAASAGATGSGAGQKAASCRTDAFSGTDIPYDQATLTSLNGAKGGLGGCTLTFSPPFTPSSPFPGAGDATARVMSFPVAGASVAIGARLDVTVTCPTPPAQLQLSTVTMSRLMGGDYTNWNAADLVADNPGLAGCDKAITRMVRLDKSGTTQTFKNYLKNGDGARTGAVCEPATSWTTLAADANNTVWPTTGTCSPLSRPATSGGGAVVTLVGGTDGAFGYADLADWSGSTAILASLQSATDATAFVAPSSGSAANCAFAGVLLPGTTNNDAVGLNSQSPARNWATDAVPSRSDVTFKGNGYPICGLTWDFVYTNLNGNGATSAIAGLTPNQRRTLYSYFTYVFSPAAQSRLANIGYAPVPATFLPKLRAGFQVNF